MSPHRLRNERGVSLTGHWDMRDSCRDQFSRLRRPRHRLLRSPYHRLHLALPANKFWAAR